jgi:hypothetical protein
MPSGRGPLDLEPAHFEVLQLGQAGIPGTEIIHIQFDTGLWIAASSTAARASSVTTADSVISTSIRPRLAQALAMGDKDSASAPVD